MPVPKVGTVLLMFKSAGSLKLVSKAAAAALKAVVSSVPPLPTDAAAAFSAKVVKGVSMLETEPPLAVTRARSGLPAGRLVDTRVASSV